MAIERRSDSWLQKAELPKKNGSGVISEPFFYIVRTTNVA
jgi:hypothetical protein